MKTIEISQLEAVTGGNALKTVTKLPLSGDVVQDIIGWGGSKTVNNIIQQVPKAVNSVVEYMRTNPAARLAAQNRRPIR